MRPRKGGEEPRRNTDEERQAVAGPPMQDPTLLALENLVHVAQQVAVMTERVTARAAYIRASRLEGRPYREIVNGKEVPLIAGLLTQNIRRLEAASTQFRRAEARALHQEGMTMEEIGQIFGLTRQRISALIHSAAPAPASHAGDHEGVALPPGAGDRDHLAKSAPRGTPSPSDPR